MENFHIIAQSWFLGTRDFLNLLQALEIPYLRVSNPGGIHIAYLGTVLPLQKCNTYQLEYYNAHQLVARKFSASGKVVTASNRTVTLTDGNNITVVKFCKKNPQSVRVRRYGECRVYNGGYTFNGLGEWHYDSSKDLKRCYQIFSTYSIESLKYGHEICMFYADKFVWVKYYHGGHIKSVMCTHCMSYVGYADENKMHAHANWMDRSGSRFKAGTCYMCCVYTKPDMHMYRDYSVPGKPREAPLFNHQGWQKMKTLLAVL